MQSQMLFAVDPIPTSWYVMVMNARPASDAREKLLAAMQSFRPPELGKWIEKMAAETR